LVELLGLCRGKNYRARRDTEGGGGKKLAEKTFVKELSGPQTKIEPLRACQQEFRVRKRERTAWVIKREGSLYGSP